jgi:hypothetical protein
VVFAGAVIGWSNRWTRVNYLLVVKSSADGAENDKQQKYILDRQDQYLRTNVIDVFGKETEPICNYLRCHQKFSEHGLRIRKCQCKHPRNSAAGAYFLLLHN